MPIKSILLFASLFMILSSQTTNSYAYYSSPGIEADDEIETLQSRHDMAALFDSDHSKIPFSEVETTIPMAKLSIMVEGALEVQNIPGLGMLSVVSNMLQEEVNTLRLSQRLLFSPTKVGEKLSIFANINDKSSEEIVQKVLEKLGHYYQSPFWEGMLH